MRKALVLLSVLVAIGGCFLYSNHRQPDLYREYVQKELDKKQFKVLLYEDSLRITETPRIDAAVITAGQINSWITSYAVQRPFVVDNRKVVNPSVDHIGRSDFLFNVDYTLSRRGDTLVFAGK